ncbi:hypothetical protein TKK_0000021 [Trichogramma kaykai]
MESDSLLIPRNPNILEKRRSPTDTAYTVFFWMVLPCWIATGIYAYVTGDSSKLLPPDVADEIEQALTTSRLLIIVGFVLLTSLYSLLFVVVLLKFRNISVGVLGLCWMPVATCIVLAALYPTVWAFYALAASVCSAVLTHVLIHTEWFYLTEAIVKETCQLLSQNGKIVLYTVLFYLLGLLLVVFGATTHMFLATIEDEDEPELRPAHVDFMMALNFVASSWIPWSVSNFAQLVIAGTFASCYWDADKASMHHRSRDTVTAFIKIAAKYHIGTVTHGAWIFGVLTAIGTIVKLLVDSFRQRGRDLKLILLTVSNLFDAVVLRFTMCSAITMCAVHGQDYMESAALAADHLARHTKRCLLMAKMTEWILFMGVIFISLLTMFCTSGYLSSTVEPEDLNVLMVFIALGSLIFVLPVFSLLATGFNTILLCVLEDADQNDGSYEKPYHMRPELRTALEIDGPPDWYQRGGKYIC